MRYKPEPESDRRDTSSSEEDKEFKDLLNQMWTIRQDKRQDYNVQAKGNFLEIENFKMAELFGVPAWVGIMIRISDKFTRLASFVRKGYNAVKDETVEDTLLDMANYSLLCLIEYRKQKEKEVSK